LQVGSDIDIIQLNIKIKPNFDQRFNMTKEELKKLIDQSEGHDLELKASTSLKQEIGQTISAFANTSGGVILIGVAPDGKIVGVDIGKKTLEDLANWIKENTDPRIYPQILTHKVDDKNIIEITVKESDEKPVFSMGHAYQRVGRTSPRISVSRIRELAKQERKTLAWDEKICEEAELEDIDENKVRWFLEKAKYERRLDINPDILAREALERLGLARNGRLTNAAILLFGKNPQRFFLMTETRCGRFKGTKPLEFIDMKVFRGSIIDQREDAVEFVKEHIRLHAKIVGTEREETWEYPIEAIREAITNSICHKDYQVSSNVQVRIFDDRIEMWGCGGLPEPLTLEDLRRNHESVLRNNLIGKCFFLIKFIEQWGTGTNRIINSCLNHGLPEPIFQELSGSLVVTLRKYYLTDDLLKTLSERQERIVEYLREHETINRQICMSLLNTSKDTAYRELSELIKKGIIVRVNKGKNAYYKLA
jgi:ATP-dependent DNA helicase RecG